MAPQPKNPKSLYPEVIDSNPERNYPFVSNAKTSSSSSSSLYPSIDMKDLAENLFPDSEDSNPNTTSLTPNAPIQSSEEVLINIPGAIIHLIDDQCSVQLACGDLTILRLRQNDNIVAVLARIDDQIQWPLAKDEAAVKLDDSHYFFSLHVPATEGPGSGDEDGGDRSDNLLNYGLTFASKGQKGLLKELDGVLETYSAFSVQKVSGKLEILDGSAAKDITPSEIKSGAKKEMMEERSAAYWTTLAPNVEDYSGCVAKVIAAGSGQLIRGILWCGDVTVDRLKWGNEFMKGRMGPNSKRAEVSRKAMKRVKRVKRVSKMSEKVAIGVLSGVVKVSGFFTSSVVNSAAGKKFFGLLPGEIVLASLDGFGRVCDAVEVAGKNVLSTSSVVTTELVSQRYGEQAGEMTNESFNAAGHALGTAWAVFKIRKGLNPKSVLKPTTLVKTAAKAASADIKKKQTKK
eukprot:TRINITY_DN6806_c0_g1_i1.p1 TRINITY_DN6806_c0_g1~~TRINITY_DN6806_c0_g1_i1.p1  ORF type:complete len:459 (+),score=90.18 TRINITY_DN6806_c0_g1_i1:260-1636(+)